MFWRRRLPVGQRPTSWSRDLPGHILSPAALSRLRKRVAEWWTIVIGANAPVDRIAQVVLVPRRANLTPRHAIIDPGSAGDRITQKYNSVMWIQQR